ncbi:MAG: fibronectin type III domain-containing protein, partial [Thermoguttaceae bacterium]|nr:fibronectin type III domain-containing protein [Thermoguttaceae bacterium]
PTPLDVPTFKSSSSTSDSITVTWNAVANASGYVVEYKSLTDADYTAAPTTNDTTIVIPNLVPDTTYKLRVYAVGDGVNYSDSVYSSVKPVKTKEAVDPITLDAPTFKSSSSTTSSVTVAWNVVANASGYVVEYKSSTDASYTTMTPTTSTTRTITNLDPSTTYKIRVYAVGDGVNYSDSVYSAVKAVKTKVETGVTVAAYDTANRNVAASWPLVEGATSYRFLKYANGAWARSALITVENGAVTSGNATIANGRMTYTINMFNAGVEGQFRIVAVDQQGKTLDDQEFSYTNFGLELDHEAYNLAGDTLTATTTPATNAQYQWYVSNNRGTTWTAIPGATSASLTLSAADASNLSWRRLVATAGGRQSVAYARPALVEAPSALTVQVDAQNQLVMNFVGVNGAESYQVEYFLADAEYPVWINLTNVSYASAISNGVVAVTATHANGANYAQYDLRVRALTSDGWSEWRYSSPESVDPITLDAPTWKSSSSTANSVTVTWNAVAYASGYVVEYKSENDSTFTPVQQTTATTITITSLASETTYKFRVLAVGDGASYSDSAYSAIKAVKTKAGSTPVSQLDAPTWKSSSSTASSVTLAWNAVANASGYVVEYKDGNAATFTPLPQTASTTLTIPNLNAETTYKFRVLAVGNGASYSDSAYSAIKAVKTKAGSNPVGQLDAPTWKSSSSTGSSVTVAWNAVANAQGYVVEYKTSAETNYTVAPKTTATTLTIPNLASETTYKLRVYAVGDGTSYSDSAYSAIKAVKTKAEEPAADPTITSVSYNSTTRQATITWDAIPGAATYKLQLSKDGGATWANYKTGLTVTNATVNGLYPGNAYALRVYGVSSGGATITTTYAERPFAPIALTSASDTYRPGVAISVTQTGASNATSTIKWYNVTPNGDVEITAARNKLTYTPPTTANYDIKVVATGTGDSEGAVSTLVFANYSSVRVVSYDSSTRQATLSWGAITGAATYKLQLSKDGGATWANYKTGLTTTTATINGLYVGKTYGFRVYGITSSGTTLDVSYEKLFAPANSSSSIVDAAFADFFEEEFFEA